MKEEICNSIYDIYLKISDMVKTTGNDQELGEKVRQLITIMINNKIHIYRLDNGYEVYVQGKLVKLDINNISSFTQHEEKLYNYCEQIININKLKSEIKRKSKQKYIITNL